jgi:hypothetical protein
MVGLVPLSLTVVGLGSAGTFNGRHLVVIEGLV